MTKKVEESFSAHTWRWYDDKARRLGQTLPDSAQKKYKEHLKLFKRAEDELKSNKYEKGSQPYYRAQVALKHHRKELDKMLKDRPLLKKFFGEGLDEISIKDLTKTIAKSTGNKNLHKALKKSKDQTKMDLAALRKKLQAEKTLTPAEIKKREEIAKAMERDNPDMPMAKKMAIATATAKKVAEEVELDEGTKLKDAINLAKKTLKSTDDRFTRMLGIFKKGDQFIPGDMKFRDKMEKDGYEWIGSVDKNGSVTLKRGFKEEVELDEGAKEKALKALMTKALGGKRAKPGYTSAVANNGDFVVKDGGGRIVGRIKSGDYTDPLKEDVELNELSSEKHRQYQVGNEKDRERLSNKIGLYKKGQETPQQKKDIAKLKSRVKNDYLSNYKSSPYVFGKDKAKVHASDVKKPAWYKESVELDEVLDTPQAMQSYKDKAKYSRDRAANSAAATVLRNKDSEFRAHPAKDLKTMAKRTAGLRMADKSAMRKTFKALRREETKLNELSQDTLRSYHGKAGAQLNKLRDKVGKGQATSADLKKGQKRVQGLNRSANKME